MKTSLATFDSTYSAVEGGESECTEPRMIWKEEKMASVHSPLKEAGCEDKSRGKTGVGGYNWKERNLCGLRESVSRERGLETRTCK